MNGIMIDPRPIVGITMGDPAGIGAEIICKMLADLGVYKYCKPLVVGDRRCLEEGCRITKVRLRINPIMNISEACFSPGNMDVIDLQNVDFQELKVGEPQSAAGKASVQYVEKAVKLALEKEIDAIVTAPVNKEAIHMAGYYYAGHTELIAHLTDAKDFAMLLVAGALRVAHVSTHLSLTEAIGRVKKERILVVIKLTNQSLIDLGIPTPRIAVAGLNPHAGENGLFGREESTDIKPAIESARAEGLLVEGPESPDTVFLRAKSGEFDAVVAMYHDQGHIAVKMLGFNVGVNVTIGLPIVRTSVDHGTAYDIAKLKLGTADHRSLLAATELAVQMANGRKQKTLAL